MNDAELESIRVRSEGALELVVEAAVQLEALTSRISSDKWREALPALTELAQLLPEVRTAHTQLEAMQLKESWPTDSRASRAVTNFEHGLYSLETAVAVQMKALAIDHGAPRLEDAIVQLVARSHAVPLAQPSQSPRDRHLLIRLLVIVVSVSASAFIGGWDGLGISLIVASVILLPTLLDQL